jgi:hypothetical protein
MSDWLIIIPVEIQNLVIEPSFEDGITAWTAAGAVITRQTTQSKFGVASLRLVTANAAANEGAYFSHNPGGAGTFTGSAWVFGTGGTARVRVRDQTNGTQTVSAAVMLGAWQRIEVTHTAAGGCADLRLYVETDVQQNITYFADGAQLEEQAEATTYCDGDQEGCEWLGAAHGSVSQRSAQSRAGGFIRDLQDDYHFDIGQFISTGMPPLDLSVDSYAILPGGELNSIKVQSRVFTLTGVIRGTSTANLHANKQDLLNVLKPGAVPGDQPVRIRYTGAAVVKQIAAHYESGLETSIVAEMECWERVAIRFLADDPFWYEIGESSEELDSEDGATLRYVTGRLRSTGQWDDLGLAANPTGGGTIYAIARGPNGKIYFGGSFTGWGGIAGRDYIAAYDPFTDTWETVGGASDINATVRALAWSPDGYLYAGGDFTNAAINPNADYLAQYDPSANTWTNVGIPQAGAAVITSAKALIFGLDGTLYIGGNFTTWANVANADRIVSWDGAYAAVGAGVNGDVSALAISGNGTLYIGGAFTNAGADPDADYIAYLTGGGTWSNVGGGLSANVNALIFASDGSTLYVGGVFTDAGGDANADYITEFNGQIYRALGTGLDNNCYALGIGPDDMLYAAGSFTVAGGLTVDDIAKWNGSSWAHLDVILPAGANIVRGMEPGLADPVVNQNYDLWLGFAVTGAGTFAGDVTITNDGTESAYPKITVSRIGGTSAILEEVRNETTGKELLFDYALLDGETLTIDLTPTAKSIVSSFFGLRPDAILPNSDFGSFALQPGDNLVTCFVATDATVEAFLLFKDTYWSND